MFGEFLTIIFLSHYVVECGRPSVAAISTHLLPFCKGQSRPLLQASERVGTAEEYIWRVPRKLQWNACFYEPSHIWGCHAVCVSGISTKEANNSSWWYRCLHVVAFHHSETVAVQTPNSLTWKAYARASCSNSSAKYTLLMPLWRSRSWLCIKANLHFVYLNRDSSIFVLQGNWHHLFSVCLIF